MNSQRFYQKFLDQLRQGPVVLATVIEVKGSVPRKVGAKMLIWNDWATYETIGGGAGEAKVIWQAREVKETGQAQAVTIDLTGSAQHPAEGVCGGSMRVWLARWQGTAAIETVEAILAGLASGRGMQLTTPIAPAADQPIQLNLLEPHSYRGSRLTRTSAGAASLELLIEEIIPAPVLLIVGAGHVGMALAQVAQMIGFQTAVADERSDFASAERFPMASWIFNQPIETALTALAQTQPTGHLYVALVTRGYLHDLTALRALFTPAAPHCAYIGMIGSQKRIQQVFSKLKAEGIPAVVLATLYTPIGLQVGAQSPEEIAVSIGAELIQVRRQQAKKPLKAETF
ncbi:XdhC family protein [Romeria aff. gracilis LEGE 07310]|uniref:XdhC family protein n=1 Tax=Vasconcelosia minhoensis LEGE 07310 TaxID=915328 RepID=A0A8J7DBI9_9CYAN|nr:XdhC/CoxI family protein [Romeria gracilis]MBE9076463.1 XdhC family protein [Romeria aff. gracilis LEGE 07310]